MDKNNEKEFEKKEDIAETVEDIKDADSAEEDILTLEEEAAEEVIELEIEVMDELDELSADDAEDLGKTSTEIILSEEHAEELEPELELDEGEALDADEIEEVEILDAEEAEELTDEEKEEKRRLRNKRLKKAALIIGGVLLVVYLGFAFFFNTHFYFNTYINGYNYSLNTVSQVEEDRIKLADEYVLTLKRSDGTVEMINGKKISIEYAKDEGLQKALKSQNSFLWPISIFQKQEMEVATGVSYDDAKLQEQIDALNCMKPETQVAPVSAHPVFKDTEFVIQEEQIGSQIQVEDFNRIVRENIEQFDQTLDMFEEGCYVPAKFLKDAPEVAAARDAMNSYLGAQITYTFGSNQEIVDSAKISNWLTTDENMQVTFQKEQVAAYIAELAAKYDTYKKERTFTGGNGNTVKVTGGDYGWLIDQEAEYAALAANIENKEVITKEPVYTKTAASHDGPDWGNSYVEIDLSNQRVYLFKDGALVDSAPCVTGNVSQGNATPQGVYSIKYCQRGATLRGPKQPDGTYEWESPVRYWMPFNGGIGLHDADWRGSFGGTIYKYNGSHGCVNLPIPFAKLVFGTVSAGTPVVCHY